MREKQWKIIITFHTTAEAMGAEQYCREHELAGRLIPVPRQISASCGLAWAVPKEEAEGLKEKLEQGHIEWEAWQELLI